LAFISSDVRNTFKKASHGKGGVTLWRITGLEVVVGRLTWCVKFISKYKSLTKKTILSGALENN